MNDIIDEIRNMEIKKIELEQDRNVITDTLRNIKKRYTQDVLMEQEKTPFHEKLDTISTNKIMKERFSADKQVIELRKTFEENLIQSKLLKVDIKYAHMKLLHNKPKVSKDPDVTVKFLSEISRSINQIATNTQQN